MLNRAPAHPPCPGVSVRALSQASFSRRSGSQHTERGMPQALASAALLEGYVEHPLRTEHPALSTIYLVSSLTRWPSSGRMSFSIARRTAFSDPGVEKRTRPLMMPAVARLMIAGDPIS